MRKVIIFGVVDKVMDCDIVVSKFYSQSHYYVHIWTDTLEKNICPSIALAMGLNSTTATSIVLALINPRRLICHKTKKSNSIGQLYKQ